MFDAYTVKKVLPRLAIAVILIQLSWFITTGAIFITNQIAFGIEGLMYGAFGGSANFGLDSLLAGSSSSSATTLGTTLLFSVVGVAFGGGVLAIAAFIVIAVVVAFLSLAVRRALLILLVLLSPIALVAWILPNTERFWKMWWDNFTKLLLMFPLIMSMIAAGRIFAFIAGHDPNGDIVKTTIVLAGFFVPLLMIPKTFTLAGSAFAAMGGAIAQRGAGAQNWAQGMGKNRQKKKWANRGQQALGGKAFKGGRDGNIRDRLNTRIQQAAHLNKAGLRPGQMRANIATAVGTTNRQIRDKQIMEDADYDAIKNNDSLNLAIAETQDAAQLRQRLMHEYAGQFTDAHGNVNQGALATAVEADVSRVERVRKKFGTNPLRQRAAIQAIAGGTAVDTAGQAAHLMAGVSGGDAATMADLAQATRDAAMGAGRVDTGGSSFGAMYGAIRQAAFDPTYDEAAATQEIHESVLNSQGAGVLTHQSMKPAAIEQLIPQIQSRLQAAVASGNMDAVDQELANIANIQDTLAGTNPALAQRFDEGVLNQEIEVGDMTDEMRERFEPAITSSRTRVETREETTDHGVAGGGPAGLSTTRSVTEGGEPLSQRVRISARAALETRRGSAALGSRRRELNAREEEAGLGHGGPGPGTPPLPPPVPPLHQT